MAEKDVWEGEVLKVLWRLLMRLCGVVDDEVMITVYDVNGCYFNNWDDAVVCVCEYFPGRIPELMIRVKPMGKKAYENLPEFQGW